MGRVFVWAIGFALGIPVYATFYHYSGVEWFSWHTPIFIFTVILHDVGNVLMKRSAE